jgi:O-antigen ligase
MTPPKHPIRQSGFYSPHLPSPRTPEGAVGLAVALSILPYFMIRGWVTTALVLLGLYCTVACAAGRVPVAGVVSDRRIRWLLAAFCFPLIAVGVVQAMHHELVPRYFDAPVRFVLGGFILIYFTARRVNVVPFLQYALPGAVLLGAAMLSYPGASAHFWGARVATYFMDPLTLAQHTMMLGFMCLFLIDGTARRGPALEVFKFAGFITGVSISLSTQSRTGWLMMPILGATWLIGYRRQGGARGLALALVVIGASCASLYLLSNVVHSRVDTGLSEVSAYFSGGNRDTSVGVRLSLLRANWHLFTAAPFTGWGFRELPAVAAIPDLASLATPLFQLHAGGHNELMQNMMRMGVWGLVSRLMLFLVPLVVLIRATRTTAPQQRTAAYLGLCVVVGYLTAGLTSEVFNLIYASSLYALLVSALTAAAITRQEA